MGRKDGRGVWRAEERRMGSIRNIRSRSNQLGGWNVCTGGASLSVYGLKGYGLEGLPSHSSSENEDMN